MQVTNIKIKEGDIATDPVAIKRIEGKYYKNSTRLSPTK